MAFGLPVAEVARQVDSAVRYALGRALDREPDRLTIHVSGMRYEPSSAPVAGLLDHRVDPPGVLDAAQTGGTGESPGR